MKKPAWKAGFFSFNQERTRSRGATPVSLASETFRVPAQSAQALCFLGRK